MTLHLVFQLALFHLRLQLHLDLPFWGRLSSIREVQFFVLGSDLAELSCAASRLYRWVFSCLVAGYLSSAKRGVQK